MVTLSPLGSSDAPFGPEMVSDEDDEETAVDDAEEGIIVRLEFWPKEMPPPLLPPAAALISPLLANASSGCSCIELRT